MTDPFDINEYIEMDWVHDSTVIAAHETASTTGAAYSEYHQTPDDDLQSHNNLNDQVPLFTLDNLPDTDGNAAHGQSQEDTMLNFDQELAGVSNANSCPADEECLSLSEFLNFEDNAKEYQDSTDGPWVSSTGEQTMMTYLVPTPEDTMTPSTCQLREAPSSGRWKTTPNLQDSCTRSQKHHVHTLSGRQMKYPRLLPKTRLEGDQQAGAPSTAIGQLLADRKRPNTITKEPPSKRRQTSAAPTGDFQGQQPNPHDGSSVTTLRDHKVLGVPEGFCLEFEFPSAKRQKQTEKRTRAKKTCLRCAVQKLSVCELLHCCILQPRLTRLSALARFRAHCVCERSITLIPRVPVSHHTGQLVLTPTLLI